MPTSVTCAPALRRLLFLSLLCAPIALQAQVLFVDESSEAGVPPDISQTYGISIGDINGDALPDIFLNRHGLRHWILRNDTANPGNFSQVLQEVDAEGYWFGDGTSPSHSGGFEDTHGAAWIDYDNDGDQDLIVTTGVCCGPQFMVNEGGKLYYRTQEAGFGDPSQGEDGDKGGRSTLWYDTDADGLLEMSFMTTFSADWFEQVGNTFSEDTTAGFFCHDNQYGVETDFTGDDNLEMLCVSTGGFFAQEAYDVSTRPFTKVNDTLPDIGGVNDIVLGDFDGNQRDDMLLLTGALRPSQLQVFSRPEQNLWGLEALMVNRDRSFTFKTSGTLNVRLEWNAQFEGFTNVDIGAEGVNPGNELAFELDPTDPNVVGLKQRGEDVKIPEFLIGYTPDDVDQPENGGTWTVKLFKGEKRFINAYVAIQSDAPIEQVQSTSFDEPFERPKQPVLLLNNPGELVDATEAAQLATDLRCVSGVAGDFDNDMDLDLYLVCRDGVENVPNKLFLNDGTGKFTAVPSAGGAAGVAGLSVLDKVGNGDSVASLDYDLDGRLDVVVSNGLNLWPRGHIEPPLKTGGPYQLFNNKTSAGNWIQIDLVGVASPREAIGAKVFVEAGGSTQYREQNGGFHRWSQNSTRLHFGLAGNTRVNVSVRWQNGTIETFEGVTANHIYRITEGGEIARVFDGDDTDGDGLSDPEESVRGTDPNNPDTDGGGASDGEEVNAGLDPKNPADDAQDSDDDGLTDVEEASIGTNINNADTDGGGTEDGVEVKTGNDPLDAADDEIDQDSDGLTDAEEFELGTDPRLPDTDGGGVSDGDEVSIDLDPLDPADDTRDFDGDGLTDAEELLTYDTNPEDPDTDGGGASDGAEVRTGNDPNDPSDDEVDHDADGLTDAQEDELGTDPRNPDTDGGGLNDGEEVDGGTDPLDPADDGVDTDEDGLSDAREAELGTDPNNPDTDGGGVDDGDEVQAQLNPLDAADDTADSDGDGLTDAEEVLQWGTDPRNPDTDGGGVSDGDEVAAGTDPTTPEDDNQPGGATDSDGDGLTDVEEGALGTNPTNPDTDGGGVNDGDEVDAGTDPLDPADDQPATGDEDTDGDGLTDAEEADLGTDPGNADTDGGGASDGDEVAAGTDPLDADDDNTGGEEPPPPPPVDDDDNGGGGGNCFIATAAYGSYLQPDVRVLRQFRDEWLLTNAPGQAFVDFYYEHSPPIAQYIAEREGLRTVTRVALTPLVYSVKEPGAAGGLALAMALLWMGRRRRQSARA